MLKFKDCHSRLYPEKRRIVSRSYKNTIKIETAKFVKCDNSENQLSTLREADIDG